MRRHRTGCSAMACQRTLGARRAAGHARDAGASHGRRRGAWRASGVRCCTASPALQDARTTGADRRCGAGVSRRGEPKRRCRPASSATRSPSAARTTACGNGTCRTAAICCRPRWRHMLGDGATRRPPEPGRVAARLHPRGPRRALQALRAAPREGCTERFEHEHRVHACRRPLALGAVARHRAAARQRHALPRRRPGHRHHAAASAWRSIIEADRRGHRRPERRTVLPRARAAVRARAAPRLRLHHRVRNRPATRARMLAFWRGGGFDANFEYELAGTPCERVMREGSTRLPSERACAACSPVRSGRESYLGLPIFAPRRRGHRPPRVRRQRADARRHAHRIGLPHLHRSRGRGDRASQALQRLGSMSAATIAA